MVSKIVNAANGAAANIANRTETNWEDTVKLADKLNINEKINTLVAKALSSENASANFNQLLAPQLSSLAAVSKASVGVVTSKAAIAQSRNNATAANALKSIAGLVTAGMKKVSDADAANDLKSAATLGTDYVIGLQTAANSTVKQDQESVVSVIGNAVKNSATAAFTARQKELGTKLSIMSSDYVTPLKPGTKSPQQMVDEANAKNAEPESTYTPKTALPGSSQTTDLTVPVIGQSKVDGTISGVTEKSTVTNKSESNKKTETQAEKDAKVIAEAKAVGALDTIETVKTAAMPTKVLTFKSGPVRSVYESITGKAAPVGAVIVKTSSGKVNVRVDPYVYSQLKSTYKDDQIADLLNNPRLGITYDKAGKAIIDSVANAPDAFTEKNGAYVVDPVFINNSKGTNVAVPQWSQYKLESIGLSENQIADVPKQTLDRISTAYIGDNNVADKGKPSSITTELGTIFQNPEQRKIESGLFTVVPLTAAQNKLLESQIADPSVDPLGYLLGSASKLGNDLYTKLFKSDMKDGYVVEPTVQGLLELDKIANSLSKPGSNLNSVSQIGDLTSYEVFSEVIKNADPSRLAAISKTNPRMILGASMDPSLQPIVASKLGSEYWSVLDKTMTSSEKQRFEESAPISKSVNEQLANIPTPDDDLAEYQLQSMLSAAKILTDPITPNVAMNAVLAPLLLFGSVPVAMIGKAGTAVKGVTLLRAADGTLDVLRDGKIVGKAGELATDATKLRAELKDGSVLDIMVNKDGNTFSATEVKAASSTTPSQQLKFGPDGKVTTELKAADVKVVEPSKISEVTKSSLEQLNESIAKETAKYGTNPTEYKPLTMNDIQLTEDLGQGVYRGADGQKYINYGGKSNPKFMAVAEDYDPNVKGILSVQEVDEAGNASVVKLTSSTKEADNVFHVSWNDPESGLKGTVSVRSTTPTLSDDVKQAAAQSDYESKIASGTSGEPTLASELAAKEERGIGEGMSGEEGMYEGESGSSGGGSGGSGATGTAATDYSKWTQNTDWGAEIRSLDGGKTWQVKDPETGAIMSTTEYETLLTTRTEARRAIYDADTNTYTKLTKNPTTGKYDVKMYQDSAGGWVTKAQLDAERAAIAANNPTYTMGVDGTARIRTNDVTKVVQYLDEVTGNWVTKDVYTALQGSANTPIWSTEGYYYFKNTDGTFSILNPYTNVKQTPDEYAAYLAAKNTAVPTTQLSTYQTPSDYSSYVPDLQSSYASTVAQVATREGGIEQTLSAWDAFTQTSDFSRIITSEADTKILVKAKNGESLTEAEISRAQFLRSQMSAEGQAAFDAATGGETAANLMPATDFENLITGNRGVVGEMTDAEIKTSGLPPEKEIVVHQVKAEENLGKFFSLNEYAGVPDESKSIIRAEIGYYAGEPNTISNLLNKFNGLKSSWTLQATQAWDKIVEAIKSAKSLISEMPVWWSNQNADYGLAELVLGNNKYSNILITTAKGPSASSMPKIFDAAFNKGAFNAGTDGALAVEYTFGKRPGWVVKSPEGAYSFVAKSDLISTWENAVDFAIKPVDMYFWEKPTNVRTEFQIPDDAAGSKIIAINKIDAGTIPVEELDALTSSGGLTKDTTQEFVKIDLMTPSGALWSTVREASKSGSFQLGKTVNVIEQDAIRVAGLTGPDIQSLGADEFRAFVETNIDEFRNIPTEDLPYLTKYLDESRIEIVETTMINPVEVIRLPNEVVQIENIPNEVISAEIQPFTESSALASEYSEAAAKLEATRSNILNSADEVSQLSDDYAAASAKAAANPKDKVLAAEKVAAKGRLAAAESKLKAYNKAQWDDLAITKAKAANIRTGTGKVEDLLRELDTVDVDSGVKAFKNLISQDDALIETIQNMSRSEAEDLAAKVSAALGSDRTQAEKIMGLNYQGAANRISSDTIAKMTRTDQELLSKARIRALNQPDYQQIERILDNAKAYEGISVSSDLGRIKINNILDSSVADKTSELRKLLSDTDVKTALKDEKFADEAFNKVYDINPDLANQYQKAAQDAIIASVKADPNFSKLGKGAKDFVDQLYTKRIYTVEDMEKLAEIRANLPRGTFNRFIRGTVIGSAGRAAKWVATHKMKTIGGTAATYLAVNGAFFIYFAAEEGTQSLIQMVGFNSPVDQFANQMNEIGLPAMNKITSMLAPFDWALENIPGFGVLFPAAIGFKWYMDYAAIAQIKDKLGKITNAGLWVPATGCTQGPGCWGTIRPESEWPAYFAANPDKVQYWDADFTSRVYDIQADGSIGPNNMIAQGLGITDPALAVQIGLGHMQAAANQGAKKILTDDFSAAYAQVVKGGATSEMALKAYTDALAVQGGTLPATGAVTNTALTGLNSGQVAAITVAPTTMDALTRYATFGGTQPADAQVWRSAFIKPDGSLDAAKLKAAYPDMTAAQMKALFPAEAINKMVAADLATISDPEELAKKINEYKANGMVDSGARIEQFMPAAQAAAFTARQNDPSKFKLTATGSKVSWVDDTGYPHYEDLVKNGKILNPETGQYDLDQKRTEEDGSEFTLDTGKYAEYINSGGKDVAAFVKDPANYIQTWKGTGSSSSKGSGGRSSGGSSYSKKSTGQTGIFIDATGLGADVYENGAKIGVTDVIIEVEAGVHTITIQKTGYKSYTVPVQVYDGSIARKSVTLYTTSGTTLTNTEKFLDAIGGENALNPYHIVYAYAISQGDSTLAASAKAAASPVISGTWSFTSTEVLSLITTYGGV
jgi:hypothetical protein